MRIFIALLLITAWPLTGLAQNEKELNLPSFASLKVFGPFRVFLHPGDTEKVIIISDEDNIENVLAEVKNGRLKIKFVDDIWRNEKPRVEVYYKVLSEIVSEADARVKSGSTIKTESLRISLSSGGQADLEIDVTQLDISVTTGAMLILGGHAVVQESQVNTGGEIDALDLDCEEVYVRAGTGGRARVRALKLIDARSSMGGHVSYSGNPETRDQNTSLGGTITRD